MNGNYTHQVGDSGYLWRKEKVKYLVGIYVSLELLELLELFFFNIFF